MGNNHSEEFFNQNKTLKIGDIIHCVFPFPNTAEKERYNLVWGKWLNEYDNLVCVDMMPLSTQKKYSNAEFRINTKAHIINSKTTKQSILRVGFTGSLTIYDFKKKDNMRLKPIYFPDIIARRSKALIFSSSAHYQKRIDTHKVIRREGFTLSTIPYDMVKNGSHPTDIPDRPDMEHIEHIIPSNIGLTHDDIHYISTWAALHAHNSKRNEAIWPEPGTWPNWQDTIDVQGNSFPCCSPERKQEILFGKKHEVTGDVKPTAARVHAQKFASFRL